MNCTIQMDGSGRIELTPLGDVGAAQLTCKSGVTILKRTGAAVDAAGAVAAERLAKAERGARR